MKRKVRSCEGGVSKLRLGVIGAGSWTVASHLPNFARRADEVEFVAVCRKGRGMLERIRDDLGFAVASEDYRDVLEAGIDICLVASPPSLHYEHAKAALEAGAHVLVEKPFTIDPPTPGSWSRRPSGPGSTVRGLRLELPSDGARGQAAHGRARDRRDRGHGDPHGLALASSCRTAAPIRTRRPSPARAGDLDRPETSGGGYGQAQLTHALGLALWLTGLRGEEVFALMSAPLAAPVELHDAVSMRYDGGAIGTMSGGSCHLGRAGTRISSKCGRSARRASSTSTSSASSSGCTTAGGRGAPYVRAGRRSLRLRRSAADARGPRPRPRRRQLLARGARCPHGRDPRCRLPERRERANRARRDADRFGPAGGSGSQNRAKPTGLIRASSSCTVAPRKRIR